MKYPPALRATDRQPFLGAVSLTGRALLTMLIGLGSLAPAWADSSAAKPMKPAVLTVYIKDYKFTPNVGNVHVGDTVVFVNGDDESHTATAIDGTFDSHGLGEKGRFSHTFTKSGTFKYHCTIHTQMTGAIVVTMPKKGSAP